METNANNYCNNCNRASNEICEYSGHGVFWYQSTVGDSLNATGTDSLSYYINDVLAGTTPVYHRFWLTDPWLGFPASASCTDDSTFQFSMNWTGEVNFTFEYVVKNQSGAVKWAGTANLNSWQCESIELTF